MARKRDAMSEEIQDTYVRAGSGHVATRSKINNVTTTTRRVLTGTWTRARVLWVCMQARRVQQRKQQEQHQQQTGQYSNMSVIRAQHTLYTRPEARHGARLRTGRGYCSFEPPNISHGRAEATATVVWGSPLRHYFCCFQPLRATRPSDYYYGRLN